MLLAYLFGGLIHLYSINCCDTYICVKIQSVKSYHVGTLQLDIIRLRYVVCLISSLKLHILVKMLKCSDLRTKLQVFCVLCTTSFLSTYRLKTYEYCKSKRKWEWVGAYHQLCLSFKDSYMYSRIYVHTHYFKIVNGFLNT